MNNLASIDKLNLLVSDFELDDSIIINPKWSKKYKPRSLSGSPDEAYLTETKSGTAILADSIFLNDDNFNIDIKNTRSGDLRLLISANPNRFSQSDSPLEYSPDDYTNCIETLNNTLAENGISCDTSSSSIIRYDSCKQMILPHPLISYHPVFSQMGAKRQNEARYHDSFRFENTQRETTAYDKQKESSLGAEYTNLIRIENRFKNHSAVGRFTPFCRLSDLTDSINRDGYHQVTDNYNQYLVSQIFSTYSNNVRYLNDSAELLSVIAQETPKKALGELLAIRGIEALIGDFGSIENLAQVLTDIHSHKSSKSARQFKWRMINKLRSHVVKTHQWRELHRDRTSQLYEQIYAFAQ
jgi:hypothetical protein